MNRRSVHLFPTDCARQVISAVDNPFGIRLVSAWILAVTLKAMELIERGDWPRRLPAAFYTALEEFNRREYFACHETLEAIWIPERRSVRELYQGVLQIAVGCYHLTERNNWVGAVNLLDHGARRLVRAGVAAPTPSTDHSLEASSGVTVGIYGVAWSALVEAADRLQTHLRRLGRDRMAHYDLALLPVVVYSQDESL